MKETSGEKYQALAASHASAGSPSPTSEARLAAPGAPDGAALPRVRATATER